MLDKRLAIKVTFTHFVELGHIFSLALENSVGLCNRLEIFYA